MHEWLDKAMDQAESAIKHLSDTRSNVLSKHYFASLTGEYRDYFELKVSTARAYLLDCIDLPESEKIYPIIHRYYPELHDLLPPLYAPTEQTRSSFTHHFRFL